MKEARKVTVYNEREGVRMTYPSMCKAARALDVDVSRISRAVRTGQCIFGSMNVKARYA